MDGHDRIYVGLGIVRMTFFQVLSIYYGESEDPKLRTVNYKLNLMFYCKKLVFPFVQAAIIAFETCY